MENGRKNKHVDKTEKWIEYRKDGAKTRTEKRYKDDEKSRRIKEKMTRNTEC